MNGMLFVRAMEMSQIIEITYKSPLEDEVCPKCGREGCTCGPECDCEPPIEEVILDTHSDREKELIQDFEE